VLIAVATTWSQGRVMVVRTFGGGPMVVKSEYADVGCCLLAFLAVMRVPDWVCTGA